MPSRLLGAICLLILCGLLVAGLWPFHAPKNEVSWLSSGNGLLFGEYGSIVSLGAFNGNKSTETTPCSVEIWLQPTRDYSGTILSFYLPEYGVVPLKLWQSHGYLGIRRKSLDQFHHAQGVEIYAADIFRRGKSVLVTISSGPAGTRVYADGRLTREFTDFRFSSQNLTGQLILGNAPMRADPWSGQLKGLAVYDRELTTAEVSQHYANWTKNAQTDLAKSEGPDALYLFNEGRGSVVHNQIDSATDLSIPKRFFVLHEQFLVPPWREYYPTWSYWTNVGINIAGFIPFGFFVSMYLSSVRKIKQAMVVTIVLGLIVSLTIEVLQSFLPTRDSGMTDLMTNTLGTALGVIWFVWIAPQPWLVRLGILSRFSVEERRDELQLVE